jgi:TatD DNase family protein
MSCIDIHTHVNLARFDDDADVVVRRALDAGVWMINVGTQLHTSRRAIELTHTYSEGVYATVGLHPTHTSSSFHDAQETHGDHDADPGEVFDYALYKTLAQDPRVVAIGECGLDYYRTPTDEERNKQVEVFEQHIALANEVGKPLMLHLRSGVGGNAYKDAAEILKKQARVLGDSHFFAGSVEDAQRFWDMGYATSFTGVLTFTHDYDVVVQAAPKELIHAETDAPYAAPKPYRGTRNEPLYVREVVKKMAELRTVSVEEWQDQLCSNVRQLFGIQKLPASKTGSV